MNITKRNNGRHGSILAYFILVLILVSVIASVGAYVAQTTKVAQRRSDMIAAQQFADGGALIACSDLNKAITNRTTPLPSALALGGYTRNLTVMGPTNLYERTITTTFSNQAVKAQIWLPVVPSPAGARIVTEATTGKVKQQATVNVKLAWAYPGAIISSGTGTSGTGVDKTTAQDGNVVVDGDASGSIIVDGGPGMAIMANGHVNIDSAYASVPGSSVTMTNYGTANQIPDYTAQGTANTLFDFNRFIAVADLTTNALNTATHNNHFTNLTTFFAACNAVVGTPAGFLEGVIVVDINSKTDISASDVPNGINVKGTLFFNFGPSFGPADKIANTAALNINPANLTGLVATNPATYTTGYPPVYYDNTRNPVNIDITSRVFPNFSPSEDLPAMMYSIGILDIHGPANISGVCYTPSFMEIENKAGDDKTQYFKGSVIGGGGIYVENSKASTTIVSYDANALDKLATSGTRGKTVKAVYRK